jgi:hypothetical protein
MNYQNEERREEQGSAQNNQDPRNQPNSTTQNPSQRTNQDQKITNNEMGRNDSEDEEDDRGSSPMDTSNQRQGGDYDNEIDADENRDESDIDRD